MFKLQTNMSTITHVPYRGAGPATNDLIGGQVPIMVATVTGQLIELHNAGKLRMLAVTAPHRLIGAPAIPTVIEAGLPDITFEGFIGLFAPKGTPKPIIERIASATRTVIANLELQKLWIAAGMEPDINSTPEKTHDFVQQYIARLTPLIKAIGFTVD
jgi:tripartite-type tricarboxylate transporter receptor subunit TctC